MGWTKEQIEADVRSVTRTCLGQNLFPKEVRIKASEKWNRITDEADFKMGLVLKSALEVAVGATPEEIPDNDWEALFRRVASLLHGHRGNCGYDFNNTILSNPMDGEEHSYTCPKCGQTGSFRAPLYEQR